MDLFQYDFMLRALVGALVIGLAAPALGIYLVQRRLALIGDGIGHVALTGVGAGLLLNRSPVLVAVIAATLGAIVIELVRSRGRTSGDLALALLFYGGIAGGVMLVGLSDTSSASLNSYLFGSLTTTSAADLTTILVLGVAVLVTMLALRPALFAVCHDEEYARVSGLPVRALNLLLAVTTAVTVTIAMRAVGVLLISALMVVPVATAQQVTRGFRSTMAAAMALGLFAAGAGIWVAATADTAPGASVVLLAIASFLVVALVAAGWRALRRRTGQAAVPAAEPGEPVAEPHEVVLG
ncbi:MAG: metal ABC transporter permease [Micromonospora sp.]